MEELQGGRATTVMRLDDKVIRPAGDGSGAIHRLLNFLHLEGFQHAPMAFGYDAQGNELLSYVVGDVYDYPLTGAVASHEALTSAATLLRKYHDMTALFLHESREANQWALPPREPQEVICHNDYAPYNVSLTRQTVTGMFDFDLAAPGPRVWDVAYAVYTWAPFKTHPFDAMGTLTSQSDRARRFCDAYGLDNAARLALVETMIARLQTLVDFMHLEAEKGNQAFIANIEDGHHLAYQKDIEYLKSNSEAITRTLVK
ncbi:aminoglycoside phosphotransferase family protein [Thaumasiovibrio subtropicus]|uniref:phosphotransferase n=1 Tax=Thaumasiovibrio subtropicus TaxID=1891207 RepID=UPI000B359395|nr:aminoglycoside phosphotransferase family protein [Thaumasiovibrio subtropicus]